MSRGKAMQTTSAYLECDDADQDTHDEKEERNDEPDDPPYLKG
jgi:hypothetical protein